MIDFDPLDRTIKVEEIENLMERFDRNGVFTTRKKYRKNFYIHFIKLITLNQVMTFRNIKGELIGFCSWVLVDKKRKRDINKARWVLPDNVSEGNILYLDACLTTEKAMIHIIRNSLTLRLKDKVDEVYWYNVERSRFFQRKIKGGVPCLTAV